VKQNERGGNSGTHGREEKFIQYILVKKNLNERDLLEYLGADGGKKEVT
jgi:hypothetical protein